MKATIGHASHLVARHGILELLGQGHVIKGVLDAAQQREVMAEALVQGSRDEVARV